MSKKYFDENFLTDAEDYTGHQFNKKNDVEKLIKICSERDKEKEFEVLIFTSKYIQGLMRILRKAPGIPEVESIEHVKKDILENMQKVVEQLENIISGEDEETVNYFRENYLTPTQDNITNLNYLLADLEAVKKYLNYVKRLPDRT